MINMKWKKLLKLDRAKLERERRESRKNIDALTQLPEEDRAYMRRSQEDDIRAREMMHRDARKTKRKRTGLSPSATPRSQRRHRKKREEREKREERKKRDERNIAGELQRDALQNPEFHEEDAERYD